MSSTSAHTTTHNPAKAVQYVCRLLRSYGVGPKQLSPELVRQAKLLDAPQASQPLLAACHDLALLVLAGFPPCCAEALARLKQQLQQEALLLQDDTGAAALPQPGRLLLLHCLSAWGCPPGLVAQLTLPQPSSRAALLALCWLIAHARLFDRALQQLQLPHHLLPLLPPYPEDSNLTADARKQYVAAATSARQHHQHIQQLLQQQQVSGSAGAGLSSTWAKSSHSSGRSSSSSCWPAVQTAAHHVLATYRAATLRLQQLSCLLEARDKLLHQIQHMQQQQHPRGISPQRSTGTGSSGRRELDAGVLTAFELHLLSHPALLQQHQEALSEAVGLLQQQQECRQHAAVFFAWVASAVTEVQQQLVQGSPAPASAGSSAASKPGASKQQHQQRQQGSIEQVLPAPPLQDLLHLVQQLPSVSTQLAAGVLSRVHAQLQSAATAAGVVQPSNTDATLDLTGCAVDPAAEQQAWRLHRCVTGACTQAAAAALVQTAVLPAAGVQELQCLPDDIHASLQQLQDRQASQEQQQQEQLAAQQQVQQWSSLRHCWRDPQQQKRRQPQQQVRQARPAGAGAAPGLAAEHAACVLSAGVSAGLGSCGAGDTQAAPDSSGAEAGVGQDLQRLSSLALHVAKLLAKARAANKQQLTAAAQALLECGGEGAEGGQLVLYMS